MVRTAPQRWYHLCGLVHGLAAIAWTRAAPVLKIIAPYRAWVCSVERRVVYRDHQRAIASTHC